MRTAQRWARHEQLPIHRHLHHTTSSVYAVVQELDTWLAARAPDVVFHTAPQHMVPPTTFDRNRHTVPPAAFEQYVRGRRAWSKRTLAGFLAAIRAFNRAIDIDPVWPDAYVALAETYLALSANEFWSPSDGYPKARSAACQAMALDPHLPAALSASAFVDAFYDGRWSTSLAALEMALSYDPSAARTHYWYGLVLMNVGRHEEAIRAFRRASELEPLSAMMNVNIGRPLLCLGRFGEAKSSFARALALDPELWVTHILIGWAEEGAGRYGDAERAMRRADELVENVVPQASLAHLYAKRGDRCRARGLLQKLGAAEQGSYVSVVRIARVHAALGEKDSVTALLDEAWHDRSIWNNTYIPDDYAFAHVRDTHTFKDIVKRFRAGGVYHAERSPSTSD